MVIDAAASTNARIDEALCDSGVLIVVGNGLEAALALPFEELDGSAIGSVVGRIDGSNAVGTPDVNIKSAFSAITSLRMLSSVIRGFIIVNTTHIKSK